LAGVEFIEENDVALAGGLGKPKRRSALEGCDGNLETARWRHCGRPKAAAFSNERRETKQADTGTPQCRHRALC
jgi:hypothetical protein